LLIYLIDNTIDGRGASPRELRAVLGRLVEGLEILTEPFHAASPARVNALNPSHIILSGQSHPWEDYSPSSLTGVFELIRNAKQPILGVCGGHQQIALAYDAPVDLMGRIEAGNGYNGAKRERGYFPVETNQKGLFKDLTHKLTVWHSHFDEVKRLPKRFERTAWNDNCAIQAMQHEARPVFGVQFHPELFNDEHPNGRRIMEAFLRL
jgi:GMP synthase (glutamine-hydrolysing)